VNFSKKISGERSLITGKRKGRPRGVLEGGTTERVELATALGGGFNSSRKRRRIIENQSISTHNEER